MNACQHCGADLDTTPGSLVWSHNAVYCQACQTMTFGDISIKRNGTRDASRERILTAANGDIIKSIGTVDWVFWPDNRGYYTAFALRVIADELDRRNNDELN